ncbi:MAG: crossover junction endodeoxyribonuclease RuvC [Clostridiales bacterium]|nr:crossover junction endodeoxyribonuclease RuvC [Clostridiales bacterium]
MIILGIDPGLATLGYGIIEKDDRGNCRAIDCGVVTTPKEEGLPVRLAMLEEGLTKILEKYRPDEIAMEELFFSKNITTGIAVAHARGVALLTCIKSCGRLYEYTPMQIKQALTGYGKADKHQIQSVVTSLLHLKTTPKPDDAADALGIALCHAFASRFGELFAVGNMTRTKGNNTNVAPANAYQELMAAGARASKRGSKSGKGFSSASTASALRNATGIAGVTGVGRASLSTLKTVGDKQTTGAGVRRTVKMPPKKEE